MIKQIKKLRKTNKPKAMYLYNLMSRGLLTKIVDEKGYLCYDTEEYAKYRKNARIGRPIKGETTNE